MTILEITRVASGLEETDESFDVELLLFINSAFGELTDLGIGPQEGFIATAESTWEQFLGDTKKLEHIKAWSYLNVRLIFDPPANSFLVKNLKEERDRLGWRAGIYAEVNLSE